MGFQELGGAKGAAISVGPSSAPFDAIIETAAAGSTFPPPSSHVKNNGRMIIPVGYPYMVLHLVLVREGPERVQTRHAAAVGGKRSEPREAGRERVHGRWGDGGRGRERKSGSEEERKIGLKEYHPFSALPGFLTSWLRVPFTFSLLEEHRPEGSV
jgi:hypothetical protein